MPAITHTVTQEIKLKSALLVVWLVPRLAFTWKSCASLLVLLLFPHFIFMGALEGAGESGNTGDACRVQVPLRQTAGRRTQVEGGNRTYKHLILVEVSTNTYIILIISRKSPIPTVSLQCLILVEVITKNDHKYDLIDLHAHGGVLALYCCMYIIRSDHQVYTSMVDG